MPDFKRDIFEKYLIQKNKQQNSIIFSIEIIFKNLMNGRITPYYATNLLITSFLGFEKGKLCIL